MFDTIGEQLTAHELQGKEPSIIAAFRSLHAAERAIDAGGLTPDNATKQKLARRDAAVQEVVALVQTIGANDERQNARDLHAHDRAEHERVTTTNGHAAVDLERIRVAKSGAELSVMLHEARAYSADAARRAWAFIEPRLHELAAREQSRHIIGTSTTAFSTLCRLQLEMRDLSRGAPNRSALVDAGQRRARELRQQALEVGQIFGLDRQIEMALRKAAVPESDATATGGLVAGGWFDKFKR